MRQQRDMTLDTYRQLCLSYIYRLAWTSTGSDGTWRECTINAGDGESLKHNSVISRVCASFCLNTRVINSSLFHRTVLISVQTHQTRLHGCLQEATIPAKTSFLPIPRRKLVETDCLLHRVYVHAFPSLRASTHTFNARGDGSLKRVFLEQCSQNGGNCIFKSNYPIRLNLFLFWRICFWLGGELEKITKNWQFIIFKDVERTKNTGKSDFKHEMSLFSKKNVIFVFFF